MCAYIHIALNWRLSFFVSVTLGGIACEKLSHFFSSFPVDFKFGVEVSENQLMYLVNLGLISVDVVLPPKARPHTSKLR